MTRPGSPGFLCVYLGRTGECWECGGLGRQGSHFCSDACEESYDANVAEMEAARQRRRDKEDAFAAAVACLMGRGYTYGAADELLADWPT
jgi:hypothetical protein